MLYVSIMLALSIMLVYDVYMYSMVTKHSAACYLGESARRNNSQNICDAHEVCLYSGYTSIYYTLSSHNL